MSNPKDLPGMRREYGQKALLETSVSANPYAQFEAWFQDAIDTEIPEPNAMTVATVDATGQPQARMLLLKGFTHEGFDFFTNFESAKAEELSHNPKISLLFWWAPIERQVRICGVAQKLPESELDAYFAQRPRGSQLGAHASPQSRELASRAQLEEALERYTQEFEGKDVPRPAHWGGYRVVAHSFEFWQGRPSRLHDRIHYRKNPQGLWEHLRLAP